MQAWQRGMGCWGLGSCEGVGGSARGKAGVFCFGADWQSRDIILLSSYDRRFILRADVAKE